MHEAVVGAAAVAASPAAAPHRAEDSRTVVVAAEDSRAVAVAAAENTHTVAGEAVVVAVSRKAVAGSAVAERGRKAESEGAA